MKSLFKHTNSVKKQGLVKQGLAKYGSAAALTLSMSLGLGSGIAQAATITFAYEGIIDFAAGGAAFDAFLGETLRIEYTFDDTAMGNVDLNASSSAGGYTLSTYTATVGSNSYNGVGSSSSDISVTDDTFSNGSSFFDRYLVTPDGVGPVGPAIGGLAFRGARIEFLDSTMTAITGDGLPLIQPDPSAFDALLLRISFDDNDDFEGRLSASIVTVSAVPVPAAAWLFGSGLLAMLGLARRKTSTV